MFMENQVAPSRTKKFVGVLLMALGVCTGAAIAQQQPAPSQPPAPQTAATPENQAPKFEFFGGYSWMDPRGFYSTDENPGIPIKAPTMNKGFDVSGTKNFGNVFGFTIDGGGHFINDMRVATFLVGPQVKARSEHFQPFAHILGGVAFIKPEHTITGGKWEGMVGGGGGFDMLLTPRFGLRIFQADYLYTNYPTTYPTGEPSRWNAVRLQGGILINAGLGTVAPVSAACTAQPASLMAGEPVKIAVTPTNFNPKRTLTYTWSSTGGKVAGNDASTTVDTNGVAPGSYTVKAQVSDGRKKNPAVAECSAQFTINEPPKHPPTISCTAQPTTVRAGDPVNLSCQGNSPDGRPLTYNHTATAGKLTANGATGTLDTTGVPAGPVTINSTVSDDRNLTASTTTNANVEVPPPPPTSSKLNEITFPNDKKPARVDNTAKAILDDVALRLQREPDSKAVVVGYATEAETKKKINKNLAQQRAINTKACLDGVEASCENQGKQIDPSRIEVRTGTGDQNKAEIWIVPSGASFTGEGTTPVDESKVKVQARTAAPAPHKKAAKKPAAQ
jgi:outer membrane protein OmpA-like peptidoglycan-associated protein